MYTVAACRPYMYTCIPARARDRLYCIADITKTNKYISCRQQMHRNSVRQLAIYAFFKYFQSNSMGNTAASSSSSSFVPLKLMSRLWYTCKCPCPDQVDRADACHEGCTTCAMKDGNLKSAYTIEGARAAVYHHLKNSTYHNFSQIEATEWADNTDIEEHSMPEEEWLAYCKDCKEEKEGRKELKRKAQQEAAGLPQGVAGAAPLTPTQPSYPPNHPIGAKPASSASSTIGAMNAELISNLFERGMLHAPNQAQPAIGAPRGRMALQQLQLKAPDGEIRIRMEPQEGEDLIPIRRKHLEDIKDSLSRGIRACRSSERLAEKVEKAYRAEAETLEDAMAQIEYLQSRAVGNLD
jgi:hypothetical protein